MAEICGKSNRESMSWSQRQGYYSYNPVHFYNARPEMFRSRGRNMQWVIDEVKTLRAALTEAGVSPKTICDNHLDNPLLCDSARQYIISESRRSTASRLNTINGGEPAPKNYLRYAHAPQ